MDSIDRHLLSTLMEKFRDWFREFSQKCLNKWFEDSKKKISDFSLKGSHTIFDL